jgi:hypothetical protein
MSWRGPAHHCEPGSDHREGATSELVIDALHYRLRWHTMGVSSRSRGKLVTLDPNRR